MERAIEAAVEVDADPERVVQELAIDPAGILTGRPSTDNSTFVAEIAVPLGAGASLAHEVDVDFQRLPPADAIGRFRVAWRARDHRGALPVFGGALEVHRDGSGSRLCLTGHYSPPLGAVGALGDRLLGHRVADASVRGFLEAAAGRVDAVIARDDGVSVAARTAELTTTVTNVCPELYLG